MLSTPHSFIEPFTLQNINVLFVPSAPLYVNTLSGVDSAAGVLSSSGAPTAAMTSSGVIPITALPNTISSVENLLWLLSGSCAYVEDSSSIYPSVSAASVLSPAPDEHAASETAAMHMAAAAVYFLNVLKCMNPISFLLECHK